MRCKKHLFDDTSAVGVCSTCLTERLSAIIEAQALAEEAQLARSQEADRRKSDAGEDLHHHYQGQEDRRKSDAAAPLAPLAFPCSVDPYIPHRKSDYSRPNRSLHRRRQHAMSDQLFYSAPRVGPPAVVVTEEGDTCGLDQKSNFSNFNFCLLSRLFRCRSRSSNRPASSNRPSWWSNALVSPGRQKDEPNRSSVDGGWKPYRRRRCSDRGMSPARVSDCGDDEEEWRDRDGSDYSPAEEWKQTPQTPQRPTATPARRFGVHSRTASRLSFCLSPLVRPSPSRQWNQKGMMIMPPPEVSGHSGEVRVPALGPRLSTGGLNRSRKLADFGRCNYGHR